MKLWRMVHYLLNNINDPFAKLEAGQDFIDFTELSGAKAFDTMGFADSEGASNGRAGTQEVDGDKLDKLELAREKREKRDKTNELIELGYQLRQSRVESITVGGISLSIGEWENIQDTLADPAKLGLVREQMRAEGKSDAVVDKRLESDRSAYESQNADVSRISEQPEFVVSRAQTMDDISLVQENVSMRDNMSFGEENPFASAYSPSAEFNARASGTTIAEATPQNIAEAQINTPTLSNG